VCVCGVCVVCLCVCVVCVWCVCGVYGVWCGVCGVVWCVWCGVCVCVRVFWRPSCAVLYCYVWPVLPYHIIPHYLKHNTNVANKYFDFFLRIFLKHFPF